MAPWIRYYKYRSENSNTPTDFSAILVIWPITAVGPSWWPVGRQNVGGCSIREHITCNRSFHANRYQTREVFKEAYLTGNNEIWKHTFCKFVNLCHQILKICLPNTFVELSVRHIMMSQCLNPCLSNQTFRGNQNVPMCWIVHACSLSKAII